MTYINWRFTHELGAVVTLKTLQRTNLHNPPFTVLIGIRVFFCWLTDFNSFRIKPSEAGMEGGQGPQKAAATGLSHSLMEPTNV